MTRKPNAVVIALVLVAGAVWWWRLEPSLPPASPDAAATHAAPPARAEVGASQPELAAASVSRTAAATAVVEAPLAPSPTEL